MKLRLLRSIFSRFIDNSLFQHITYQYKLYCKPINGNSMETTAAEMKRWTNSFCHSSEEIQEVVPGYSFFKRIHSSKCWKNFEKTVTIENENQFSVDEIMIGYKSYKSTKAEKWGMMLFVRAGISRILWYFGIYRFQALSMKYMLLMLT